MSESRDLLVEIGTEELPPKALPRLSAAFADGIARGLKEAELAHTGLDAYATPRRLAVLVHDLAVQQPERRIERRGPALGAAFDEEGRPTRAALGFARSCGVEVDALERLETPQGAWLAFRRREPGAPAADLIPDLVRRALHQLPIPRRMRWSDLDEQFVRPVHWCVLLHGEEVIPARILGVEAGRETRGHRFHHPEPIPIPDPAVWAALLESEGRVIADFEVRRQAIRGQVLEAAAALGGQAVIDEALLDEVTSMTEWPRAIAGHFEARFLEVPQEALISAMKGHQKYFHVVDAAGALLPHFVTVANIESTRPEVVRAGNERVIRPRLADAAFFWDQDRKRRLADRVGELRNVVFQQRLGSLHDKVVRLQTLAGSIAAELAADAGQAARAALLCKCDLLTDMVGEFPELQGVMGRYYALHDGEPEAVARAIDEHYMPRHAGDRLAGDAVGRALALADRLDTLAGIFGIGQPPSGDKDPFALRRAALGVLRTLIECGLDLDLDDLVARAVAGYGERLPDDPGLPARVADFILERLRAYYTDRGIPVEVFEAVRACRPSRPLDFDARVRAVAAFRELPQAEALSAANKRISNILRKAGEEVPDRIDEGRLEAPEEQALHRRLREVETEAGPLFERGEYTRAMQLLATLREPVDAFFDAVMVMTGDPALRRNRLALLAGLRRLFLRVADLGRL